MKRLFMRGASLALAVAGCGWAAVASAQDTHNPGSPDKEASAPTAEPASSAHPWALDVRSAPCWAVTYYRAPEDDVVHTTAFNLLTVQTYRTRAIGRNMHNGFLLVATTPEYELVLARAATQEELIPVLAYYMERAADCEGRMPQRPAYYMAPAAAKVPMLPPPRVPAQKPAK